MPKINVYLPDDLANAVRDAGIPVSSVCQRALADAVANADGPEVGTGAEPTAERLDLSRLTKRARTAVEYARTGAEGNNQTPKTVHLVGGLIGEGGNLALTVLRVLDVDPEDLITELRGLIRSRAKDRLKAGPLDDACARAVEQAVALGHNYIGCEHLLLGLIAGPDDELTAATFHGMGVDLATAQQTVTTAMAGYSYARENLSFSGLSSPIRSVLDEIRQRLARLEESR